MNPRRLLSSRLVSGCVQRKKYFNDKMEHPNRSLRKAEECVVLRAFRTLLQTWSAFTVCCSLCWSSDQRSAGIPPHLYDCADPMDSLFLEVPSLGGDFSSNCKRNSICKRMFDGSVSTTGPRLG